MSPHSPLPPMPGWTVTRGRYDPATGIDTEGLLIAVRNRPLSEYQAMYGGLNELSARDSGELWVLVDAQTRLAERLATAEGMAPAVRRLRAVDG